MLCKDVLELFCVHNTFLVAHIFTLNSYLLFLFVVLVNQIGKLHYTNQLNAYRYLACTFYLKTKLQITLHGVYSHIINL